MNSCRAFIGHEDTIRIPRSQEDTFRGVAVSDTPRIIYGMATWIDVAKKRMAKLGLKQADLTDALGVKTRGAVGHYLAGRREPSIEQLAALAAKLQISLGDLVGTDGSTDYPRTGPTGEPIGVNETAPCPEEESDVDVETLSEAIGHLQTYLARHDLGLSRTDFARVLILVYKRLKYEKKVSDVDIAQALTETHEGA